jgi:CRISPR system Cascade subunit CasD
MASFLCFRLHGPLASWGDIAIGERRPSAPHPSRSAVLGIVAAALGIKRDDADSWMALDREVAFASRTDALGDLQIDYHTAQGPDEKLLRAAARVAKKAKEPWHRPATRRAELSFARQELATVLSSRQYRADALWTIALWLRPVHQPAKWELATVAAALKKPHFIPYLGRKSCPLDVPMEPQVIEAVDPAVAMAGVAFRTDEILRVILDRGREHATIQWEGTWPGLVPAQTVMRRDRVLSRARWQFSEREEHQRAWIAQKGDRHVPEQS